MPLDSELVARDKETVVVTHSAADGRLDGITLERELLVPFKISVCGGYDWVDTS